MDTKIDKTSLIELIGLRTENFYNVHGLCCSEAIILVLSKGFNCELTAEMAISLGSGLCGGMGGGECVCGALNGAVILLGGLLAPSRQGGLSKKNMRKTSKTLHDNFKNRFGSTCCKDLTAKFAGDRKAKMKNCGLITGETAMMAAEILLDKNPSLIEKADVEFLNGKDTKTSALLKKIFGQKRS